MMNNALEESPIINTRVWVLKDNTPLPQLMSFVHIHAPDDLNKFNNTFKTLFPKAFTKYFWDRKKYDLNLVRSALKRPEIIKILIQMIGDPDKHHNIKYIEHIYSWCDLQTSPRYIRTLNNLVIAKQAEEQLAKLNVGALLRRKSHISILQNLERKDTFKYNQDDYNNVTTQGFVDIGLDENSRDLIEDLTDTINSKVPSVAQQVNFLNAFTETVTGASSTVDRLTEAFNGIKSSPVIQHFTKFTEEVKQEMGNAKQSMSILSKVASLMVLAYASYKLSEERSAKNIGVFTAALGCCVAVYGIDNIKELIAHTGTAFMNMFTSVSPGEQDDEVKPQGFGTFEFKDMFSIFSSWPQSSLGKLSTAMRVAKDLPDFLSQVQDILFSVLNTLTNNYFGFETATDLFNQTDILNVRYDLLIKEYYSRSLLITLPNAIRVEELLKGYNKLFMKLDSQKKNNFSKLVADKLVVLRKIDQMFKVFSTVDRSFRQEPVCIIIEGDPGNYKSIITEQMIDYALSITLTQEEIDATNRENLVYPRNSLQEFWSNYFPTTVVTLMDDFGQVRDAVGSTSNSYADLISMRNTAPFMLNMPGLEDKGNTFFNSKWIIGSTNCKEFKPNSLIDSRAIDRRIDMLVTLVPLPEYALDSDRSKIDPEKVKTEHAGILNISMDKYQYAVIYHGKRSQQVMLSHTQFLREMRRIYDLKVLQHITNAKRRKDMIERLRADHNVDTDVSMTEQMVRAQSNDLQDTLLNGKVSFASYFDKDDFKLFDEDLPSSNYPESRKPKRMVPEVPIFLPGFYDVKGIKAQNEYLLKVYDLNSIKGFNDPSFLVSEPLLAFLANKVDDMEIMMYMNLYRLFDNCYGSITDCDLPPLLQGINPFVVFCCLMQKNPRYGEYLFRGYDFTHISIENTSLLVAFDVSFATMLKDYAQTKMTSLLNWISTLNPMLQVVALVAALSLQYYVVYKATKFAIDMGIGFLKLIYNWMFPVDTQSVAPKYSKNKTVHGRTKMNIKETIEAYTQGRDLSGVDIHKKIIKTNTSEFVLHIDGEEPQVRGIVLWLDKHHFVVPQHYVTNVLDKYKEVNGVLDVAYFTVNDHDAELYRVAALDVHNHMIEVEESDTHLLYFKVTSTLVKEKRDIIKYFVQDADIKGLSNSDLNVSMIVPSESWTTQHSGAKITRFSNNNLTVSKAIQYTIDTGDGDCGVPIVVRDAKLGPRRIIGIHVGGNPKHCASSIAVSSLLTQETVNEAIKILDAKYVTVQAEPLKIYHHSPYQISNIVPSKLTYTTFPETTKHPSLLFKTKTLDPYAIALEKYFRVRERNVHMPSYERAVEDYTSFLCSFPWILDSELVPVDEAIWGNERLPYRKALPASTSVGYPMKFTDKDFKQRLLGEHAVRDKTNIHYVVVEQKVWYYIERMNQGIRDNWYFTDNLKDALTTMQKFLDGKSRLFSGADALRVMCDKVLFGEFQEFMSTDCLTKGTATTINPYGDDWKQLAHILASHSENFASTEVLPVDYSGFDCSQWELTLKTCCKVINNWYTFHGKDQYNTARETAFMEVYNSKHVANGEIVEWKQSLPSGHFLTLLINNLTNHVNVRYCYYRRNPNTIDPFHTQVALVTMGDDLIASVSDKYKDSMCVSNIIEDMYELGFTITSDEKDQQASFKSLVDSTFLKRSFNIEKGNVYAPLSMETIMNTPLWTKRGSYYNKITRDNIKFFFRELSLHDKDTFDKFAPMMRKAISEAGISGIEGITYSQFRWRQIVATTEPFLCDM